MAGRTSYYGVIVLDGLAFHIDAVGVREKYVGASIRLIKD